MNSVSILLNDILLSLFVTIYLTIHSTAIDIFLAPITIFIKPSQDAAKVAALCR